MTMAIINSIYEKSPYFIKVISLNLYSIRQKSINYGPLAKSRLKELTAFDINNKFAVRSYQERQLKKMLTYAKVNVPYYKDISIDFPKKSPQDFFKWFYSEIPLLNKATVKDDPQRFYANNMDEGRPLFFHTSGTMLQRRFVLRCQPCSRSTGNGGWLGIRRQMHLSSIARFSCLLKLA